MEHIEQLTGLADVRRLCGREVQQACGKTVATQGPMVT
jgi:hypothetical protein